MAAKYQLFKDKQGQFRFRLIAENGRIIVSGEAYVKHASCVNGIESVKKNSMAAIEDTTTEGKVPFPKYQVYVDKAGEFRFNLSASNGEVIASSEGYSSKDNCLKGIATLQRIGNSEIEDLTIEQNLPETIIPSENPEATLQAEENVEPPLIVAQATTSQEIDNNRKEPPIVMAKANSSKNILAIVGLLIGTILLAVGAASLGAVLGPIDTTLGTVVLLTGEVVIGIGVILFVAWKK